MSEREIDSHTGVETTGHEWDGIKELNSPLPRWWLWTFYADHPVFRRLHHLLPGNSAHRGLNNGYLGADQIVCN